MSGLSAGSGCRARGFGEAVSIVRRPSHVGIKGGSNTRSIALLNDRQFDMIARTDGRIWALPPVLTTSTILGEWHVMAAHQGITPTTQILDDAGRDWAWAFVVYRPVPGYGRYLAGSDASIWRIPRPRGWRTRTGFMSRWYRVRTPLVMGYPVVVLFRHGERRMLKVHRVILETFIGPCPEGMEGCHNDGNRENNSISNLRWDYQANNMKDRDNHGRTCRGDKNGSRKISSSDVLVIRQRLRTGEPRKSIGRDYGITTWAVGCIERGKTWKDVR